MDEKLEWDEELYDKLSFDFLIECAENNRIDEWNVRYEDYLESEWNRLYPEREWDPENVVELIERDSQLKRPDFSRIDFREAISRGVRFIGVRLDVASFWEAQLDGADFNEAHLVGANFSWTQMAGANFNEAQLVGVGFWEAQLDGADFRRAQLDGANFSGANMKWADFRMAQLDGADFNEAHLGGANFSGAHLKGANFSGAQLKGAYFIEAQMEEGTLHCSINEKSDGRGKELYEKLSFAYLIKCAEHDKIDEWNDLYLQYLESEWNRLYPEREWDPKNVFKLVNESSLFIGPDLNGKDFREAIFRGVHFKEAQLDGANFSGAQLDGAEFSGAQLDGANFSGAQLKGANFFMAHLVGADLSWTQLKGANFMRAQLDGAEFRRAYLVGADFNEAHLEGANFSWTHMVRANFNWTHTEGAIFIKAHMGGTEFRWTHMKEADFQKAHLEGANFGGAHLEGADFQKAHLEGANFGGTHLEGAKFRRAYLEGARLDNTHLNGADFKSSYLQGANLSWAIVNENTSFQNIRIDDATGSLHSRIVDCKNGNGDSISCKLKNIWREKKGTDFSNVALGTCRIDTLTKTRIEKNIRVYRWNDWYKNHVFLQIIMRPFWFLTDYGSSTKRPIFAFILWNTIFSIIYFLWLGSDFQELMTLHLSPIWENIGGNIVIFLTDWMKSNLMIISLTDMATTKIEPLTLFFVFLHVFVGYFILAALIARFSIMFQNLSPNEE